VILGGMLLAAVTYYPLYSRLGAVTQPGNINYPIAIFIIFILVCYVGMVYGPVGVFLAEFFPGRIRYTSVSVPYHIGNGLGWRIGAVHHLGGFRVHRQHRLRAALSDRGSGGVLHTRALPNAGDP
jgi:hypothetical protein